MKTDIVKLFTARDGAAMDYVEASVPGMKGDLLVVRANFDVKRSDYNINPKAPADKVNDEINLTLAVAGASPK